MITRHHLTLVLICTLILGVAIYPSDIIQLSMFAAGSCAGAVLPDIHMKKPKRTNLRTIAFYISRFTVLFCSPVLIRLCHAVNGMSLSPSDKRLSHSVPGIFIIGSMVGGVLAGLAFHLIEDSCTRKGFSPLFPFSAVKISGTIRPCDKTDSRIMQYHFHHCSMIITIFGFHFVGVWPQSISLLLSLVGLCSCLAMMVWFSNLRIETSCPLSSRSPWSIS
jgi:hypothetical protein